MNYKGLTALVTGASSGLGEEFARQLAALGADLVLAARSEDKLMRLAEKLREEWKIAVTVMPADLSSSADVERLILDLKERGVEVDLLVNNAGVGLFRNFLDTPVEGHVEEVELNVCAVVRLTHALAGGMVARQRGGVINVASTAGFQPAPGAAVYGATKAFVLLFSEALSVEVKASGVRVLAACPGPVATNFFADMKPTFKTSEMDRPEVVVREILAAFEKGKRVVFPGKITNWLGTFGARLLPRNTMLGLAAGIIRQFNPQ